LLEAVTEKRKEIKECLELNKSDSKWKDFIQSLKQPKTFEEAVDGK